ncbi:YjdF family protein [Ideonella sp. DXS29W]|uniref:YjdF family protein n=1 Tax=Ideonella lacteola TaxID=2984193 RepID=A0ABU9BXS5_9BURK
MTAVWRDILNVRVPSRIQLTLYFDGQFWVGVLEREESGSLRAARHVFGAEPHDEEVAAFIRGEALSLLEGVAGAIDAVVAQPGAVNPKRLARQAAREMLRHGVTRQADAALQASYESRKKVRVEVSREQRLARARQQYLLARDKAKKRHRGK